MQGGGFHNGMLTGKLGEGYNDDADETRKAILLNGFESPYTTLGIIGYQEQQWLSFGDLYYATGTMCLVDWDIPADSGTASTSVTRAADGIAPSGSTFPVSKH